MNYHAKSYLKLAASDKLKRAKDLLISEITPETEWIKFDGDTVEFVQLNWPGVIAECLENNIFPTQLFYEKPWADEEQKIPSNDFS